MANLKSLFGNLLRKAGGYTDDIARLTSKYSDDIVDASTRVPAMSLNDLDNLIPDFNLADDLNPEISRLVNKTIEPITIGNYINPDKSPLTLAQIRAADRAEASSSLKNLYSRLEDAYNPRSFDDFNNSDFAQAFAPGGSAADGTINPYLGISETNISEFTRNPAKKITPFSSANHIQNTLNSPSLKSALENAAKTTRTISFDDLLKGNY